MYVGEGFGKIILFGEHFVVHGKPAIAAGISNRVRVKIKHSKKNEIITDYPVNPKLSISAIKAVEKAMKTKEKFKVYFDGNLPTSGGLGSSAAFCVALARAISHYQAKSLTSEEINSIAFEGEKVFHGNPSGVDNTAATYGGALLFRKGEKHFKRIKLGKPLHLVVANTGKIGKTKKLVSSVKQRKEKFPQLLDSIFDSANKLVFRALIALKVGDLKKVGELMDINHGLLSSIGVSSEKNEELIHLFRHYGALGAKITGAGGGGSCIALAKNSTHANQICKKVKHYGFEGFCTKVD